MNRSAGVILHPSALPSPYGIGNFGPSARQWIDALSDCGFKLWQMCPTGPTGYGDSPYQCFSAFAGNPYFIDWDAVIAEGYLDAASLKPLTLLPSEAVDYGALFERFWPIVEKAFQNFKSRLTDSEALQKSVESFYTAEADWLYDYCNFRAMKESYAQKPCTKWPPANRSKLSSGKQSQGRFISESAEKHAFTQYLFFTQFYELKAYAQERGIQLIGDIPIFVALDSADVWANPHLFDLNSSGQPNKVAGVPPDYFSEDGQLWGNPLFAWKAHKRDQFRWWIRRIQHNLKLYDCVRIDHFRGFESCWAVPSEDCNAINGQWEPAPGKALFKRLKSQFPQLPIIAEDLGVITPPVEALLKETGFPGMAVLQFAFSADSEPSADNPYLPHNLKRNQVVYSGTHDNDTSIAWFASLDSNSRKHAQDYLKISGETISWDLFRAAISSVADYAIVPLQDLFSLGGEARFNNPGTAQGNWSWRYQPDQLAQLVSESANYIRKQLALYQR